MSDDIVTRLRTATVASGANPTYVQALQEAANEIERLRADLASCRQDIDYWYERCTRTEACAHIMHNQINKKWWKR